MHATSNLQAPSSSLALGLARFARGLTLASMPEAVREKSLLHIIDAIGLGIAAHQFDFSGPGLAGIRAAGAPGDATVIGGGAALQARDAAMANGYLMHGLDFDDTHPGAIVHPSVACLPAALALGETLDLSWAELLTAYAIGMETAIRLGRSVKGGFHQGGYHATGVVSHFSSALVAGKLLGLSEDQLVAAQGIAASTASGVQVFLEDGAWTKRLHPGWGAFAGITAAQMAQAGFFGPRRPYEGQFGLYETHMQARADQVDADSVINALGAEWTLMETSIKPYPVCHFIHGCAEAALRIHARIKDAGRIRSVECDLPAATLPIVADPAHIKTRPRSDYDAKFSVQFVVAGCLALGRFTLQELAPARLADPALLSLAGRTTCRAQEVTAFPRYFSGAVTVTLHDGTRLQEDVPVNLGSGERALGQADIVEKFKANAGLTLPDVRVALILDAFLSAEPSTPVRALTKLLG
ncbi:MmgE/PrpD family protein [Achromobacter arsenitoxydans]|uniref:Putative MmgE/PrpD family protein n=1 Tax=Achromobacter arsenitoxydans SY8 TaxID=477184 RepID=H0F0X6_9BURK|nr:MmgE/PrpD family protein [Achromobacter arsenitoxydans]EHK68014.1 putative MmgE/PrpD family protein [Achromobacter arsenitoxydans SY8]